MNAPDKIAADAASQAEAAAHGQAMREVPEAACAQVYGVNGVPYAGWFQFQIRYARELKHQPDFLD